MRALNIDLRLLDGRRRFKLGLIKNDLLLLYRVAQVDELVACLPEFQGCVQLCLNVFGVFTVKLDDLIVQFGLKLRSVERCDPVTLCDYRAARTVPFSHQLH